MSRVFNSNNFVFFVLIIFFNSITFGGEKIKINNSGPMAGHYLEWNGKTLLLIGDSVTQGWMECGNNFNQIAYIDALAERGINIVMLWSYFATNAVMQQSDSRIGYNAPEIWPWQGSPDEGNLNLTQFNQAYFNRLKQFVSYAESKEMVVLITVQDGWTKDRFEGHPFNTALGNGPLETNSDFVELYDYNNEMPATYNSSWNWKQKNQYFQERFCDKLIDELNSYTNVIYEMFNEGEWYNELSRRRHEEHFLEFFSNRCDNLLLSNTDHIAGDNPHENTNVDVVSLHGEWADRFSDFANGFYEDPPKPYLLSEPVPGWDGEASLQTILHSMWEVTLAGAGWVNQNDLSFGWDPNTNIANLNELRDEAYDYAGNCSRFFNESGIDFSLMQPLENFASTSICLANPGEDYIVFVPGVDIVRVSLSLLTRAQVTWFNPKTGNLIDEGLITGILDKFTPPSDEVWILHLKMLPLLTATDNGNKNNKDVFQIQNYPNPFNPVTKISFTLASEQQITLKVYNVLGEEIEILLNDMLPQGYHEVEFNGASINAGIYFYELRTKDFASVRKMILLK